MHQPIRENLEDYLNGDGDREMPPDFAAHLESCTECVEELLQLHLQSQALRLIGRGAELEPRAGFYARVMDRIEAQTDNSIWAIFLRPSVGRRLAVASAVLVLLLGTYFISTEPGDSLPTSASQQYTLENPGSDLNLPVSSTLPQQRDAVLVNLASYHE